MTYTVLAICLQFVLILYHRTLQFLHYILCHNSHIKNSSNHFEPFFNELLSFLEICNNSNYKSYIFSDTNIDLLKQNNDVVSEYTMHILSSGFFPLNFAASRIVNLQSFALLDHIITKVRMAFKKNRYPSLIPRFRSFLVTYIKFG